MKTKLSYKKEKDMDAPTTVKKKDNKYRLSLSTVLSMVNVVFFFYHDHYSYLVSHRQN